MISLLSPDVCTFVTTDLKYLEGRYVPGDGAHDAAPNIQSGTALTGFFQQLHEGLAHKHCLHSHTHTEAVLVVIIAFSRTDKKNSFCCTYRNVDLLHC